MTESKKESKGRNNCECAEKKKSGKGKFLLGAAFGAIAGAAAGHFITKKASEAEAEAKKEDEELEKAAKAVEKEMEKSEKAEKAKKTAKK